jgi:hypothetical protein
MQGDRDHANQLFLSLRNGIARFPGCKQLVGVSLESKNVEAIRVPDVKEEHQAKSFYEAIEGRLIK